MLIQKEANIITIVCAILILGVSVGLCLGSAIHNYLICKVTDLQHPGGKIVRCLRVGSDVSGNYADEPTGTEYAYPTATSTPIVSTITPIVYTSTPVAYPPVATDWAPAPYPLPNDLLYWWKR